MSSGSQPGRPGRSAGSGWTVTVYYTAVQAFHTGPAVTVRGCRSVDCTHGTADLGRYPRDFVDAVRDEGTGRTATGRYLNWSYDTGFWLDEVPRDSYGGSLRPFESAAADPTVMPAGTRFVITRCGHDSGRTPIDPVVCSRLRQARWVIADEFTPGLGGDRHIDAYIGEETGHGFTGSPWYCTLTDATIRIG